MFNLFIAVNLFKNKGGNVSHHFVMELCRSNACFLYYEEEKKLKKQTKKQKLL